VDDNHADHGEERDDELDLAVGDIGILLGIRRRCSCELELELTRRQGSKRGPES
jgi:hypothetical protein